MSSDTFLFKAIPFYYAAIFNKIIFLSMHLYFSGFTGEIMLVIHAEK